MATTVLHVAQPTEGGAALCAAQFAVDQKTRWNAVTVASPLEGDLPGWLADGSVPHVEWAATRGPGPQVAGEVRRLRAIASAVRPDIIHLHSSKAGLAGRLAIRGRIPTVFQPHAWSFEAVTGPVRKAATAWERRAARWSDAILCVSEAERRSGERVGIAGRYHVIPNGVDLVQWRKASDGDRAAARARLQLPDAPLVVCVGRISRQKGQDLLLDAWPRVLSSVPDALVALVGDGPERNALRRRSVPGVLFPGKRADVWEWFAAADVVAFPSRWEGMSLALLEAMATGRSVVASDAAGVEEALAGRGAMVPVGDAGRLADAVVGRLSEPAIADHDGAALRAIAERAHDLRVTLDAVARLYDEVLGRGT